MPTAPGPTATATELFAVMTGLRRVTRRRLHGAVDGPRLRGAQLELLQAVEAEPGIGVAAVADALHLAGNSVSTLVNQLVADGMLERERDPADRRAVRLRLSGAARERLHGWREARGRLVDDALVRLPPDEAAAIAVALPALRHLLDEIDHPDREET